MSEGESLRAKRLLGVALLAPLLLSGCTPAPRPSFEKVSATLADVKKEPELSGLDETPSIRWVTGSKERVLLTMQGGVSCPRIPVKLEVVSPVKVILKMKTYKGVCTTDTGPQTSEFALPEGVSRSQSVAFTVTTTDPEPSQKAVLHTPR